MHVWIFFCIIFTIIFISRVKKEDQEFRKKIRTTGGGLAPQLPNYSEEMTITAAMMSADLEMPQQAQEFGVTPVSLVEATPPGNIMAVFLQRIYDLQSDVLLPLPFGGCHLQNMNM